MATIHSGTATAAENIQIPDIITIARRFVLLKTSGKQIAYHRSTAIALRVKTDTDIDTA